MKKIIIGTRGSRLSLAQTKIAVDAIKKAFPRLLIEIKVIKTYGDVKKDMKLDRMEQKGVFVKDIDRQLAEGAIDNAVHSLKDIPTRLPDQIRIGAIIQRADPRDVLVSRGGERLLGLCKGARIGTSSLRRKGQLLAFRRDFRVVEMRGNVDKRIAKLYADDYDAIVLAAAGMLRLGMAKSISEYLPLKVMLPAPGQGALAVEIRNNDKEAKEIADGIDNPRLRASVEAERTVLSRIGGGCNALLGVFAQIKGKRLNISAAITSKDGSRKHEYSHVGSADFPEEAGQMLAEKILMSGASDLAGGKKQKSSLKGRVVLVTREEDEGEGICQMLLERGAIPVYFPTIKTVDLPDASNDPLLEGLDRYDMLIITSRRGASKLVEMLRIKGIRKGSIRAKVVAIGPETQKYLQENNVVVHHVPRSPSSKRMASGLDVKGKRVLIINSAKAPGDLSERLTSMGAKVDRIMPYTLSIPKVSAQRRRCILGYSFDFITFASPSAVEGLIELMGRPAAKKMLLRSKVVCIGNTTAGRCIEEGIKVHFVSKVHSLSGIVGCMERFYRPR